jgi:hypothetical protein
VVLDLVEGFFCIYGDDQVVFVFASIDVQYYIYRFVYVEPPCIPGMKLTWSWCFWIWFAIILLRTFALIFIKESGL